MVFTPKRSYYQEQLLHLIRHYMDQGLRAKLREELPVAYESWMNDFILEGEPPALLPPIDSDTFAEMLRHQKTAESPEKTQEHLPHRPDADLPRQEPTNNGASVKEEKLTPIPYKDMPSNRYFYVGDDRARTYRLQETGYGYGGKALIDDIGRILGEYIHPDCTCYLIS